MRFSRDSSVDVHVHVPALKRERRDFACEAAVALVAVAFSFIAFFVPRMEAQHAADLRLDANIEMIDDVPYVDGAGETIERQGREHKLKITAKNIGNTTDRVWVMIHAFTQDAWYPFAYDEEKPEMKLNLGEDVDPGTYQVVVFSVPPSSSSLLLKAKGGFLTALPSDLKPLSVVTIERTS
jgi:hypothetical protein